MPKYEIIVPRNIRTLDVYKVEADHRVEAREKVEAGNFIDVDDCSCFDDAEYDWKNAEIRVIEARQYLNIRKKWSLLVLILGYMPAVVQNEG